MSRGLVVGVLGGMGPAATWDFCREVLAATPAKVEQEHLRLLVDSDPGVPNRHAALRGEGASPAPHLGRMARGLVAAGAEVLCMPCNTAHVFASEVRDVEGAQFVDMIEATVAATRHAAPGVTRVGLLATTTTVTAGVYPQAFEVEGVEVVVPNEASQARLMELVFAIKGGDVGKDVRDGFRSLAAELVTDGVGAVVAGCTEVPLVLTAEDVSVPYVASTRALAEAVVRRAVLHAQ